MTSQVKKYTCMQMKVITKREYAKMEIIRIWRGTLLSGPEHQLGGICMDLPYKKVLTFSRAVAFLKRTQVLRSCSHITDTFSPAIAAVKSMDRAFSVLTSSMIFSFLKLWHLLTPGQHSQLPNKCTNTNECERKTLEKDDPVTCGSSVSHLWPWFFYCLMIFFHLGFVICLNW